MDSIKEIARFPSGIITPPPSKSLSHRAVICSALAANSGESIIENLGESQDIKATLSAMSTLGARFVKEDGKLRVRSGDCAENPSIDCGESGSTLRFLIPIAALYDRETVFAGRGRLLERPLDAYSEMFADCDVSFTHDSQAVRVRGPLHGGIYTLPGNVSSQFVSGLLFALPLAEEDSEIRLSTPLESRQYVDLTIDVMRRFGVAVTQPDETRYFIQGGQQYQPARYEVEADYSQAAYFLAAAALGRDIICAGLSPESKQGDRAILEILREMGAVVDESGGLVKVQAGRLRAVTVDAREIPDIIPPISVLCCFCEGTSRIVNAGRLRLKESDRLRAMASELSRLGARVEEGPDSLTIEGVDFLEGGQADAHNDHRIAMSMALAAIRCRKPVRLSGWRSVDKSYPNFWRDFEGAIE